jgi:predicted MFS family arabinose efflux permease
MSRTRWQVLWLSTAKTVSNTMYRMVYPFLAVLARGTGVDVLSMSNALMLRSLVGAVGPFAATLADHRGRRFGMLLGMGAFALGLAVVVIWPTFPALVLAILLSTLGKFVFDPSMQAFLGDRIPYARRGRTMALVEFSWSLAFILGVPLMGFLIARRGWMAPFPLLLILAGIIFIGMLVKLPRDGPRPADGQYWSGMRLMLASVPALAGLAIGLFSSLANEMVNLIFGVWLEDSLGLQIASLGAASMVIGLSELGAEGLVAGFVDRIGKPRAIALGLIANSLSALVLFLVGGTTFGALVGLFFFYLTFEFTIVSNVPLLTELLPAARATLMGFNLAAQSLGRAMGDWLAPRVYEWGFLYVVLGSVLFNLLALAALQRLRRSG